MGLLCDAEGIKRKYGTKSKLLTQGPMPIQLQRRPLAKILFGFKIWICLCFNQDDTVTFLTPQGVVLALYIYIYIFFFLLNPLLMIHTVKKILMRNSDQSCNISRTRTRKRGVCYQNFCKNHPQGLLQVVYRQPVPFLEILTLTCHDFMNSVV